MRIIVLIASLPNELERLADCFLARIPIDDARLVIVVARFSRRVGMSQALLFFRGFLLMSLDFFFFSSENCRLSHDMYFLPRENSPKLLILLLSLVLRQPVDHFSRQSSFIAKIVIFSSLKDKEISQRL